MLKTLKYCLLLITFVSAIAQQSDDLTNSIKESEVVAEALCIDDSNIQAQDLVTRASCKSLTKKDFLVVGEKTSKQKIKLI